MKNTKLKNPLSVSNPKWGAERLYYLSHFFWDKGFHKFAMISKRFNQFIFHVNIPPQVKIGARLDLPHSGFGVVIHYDTVIGDDAVIFHNVTIGNGGARIGNRVYIGTGAVILGAVNIGNDIIIGANTVVNFDVQDGVTVVGVKSIIIKKGEDS
jgi:serine O-acetyltransferase